MHDRWTDMAEVTPVVVVVVVVVVAVVDDLFSSL